LDFDNLLFLRDCKFDGFLRQAAAFAEHVASGALVSEFAAERRQLEGRIECLQAQHTEVVRDNSAAENKSRKLKEKLTAAKAEKEDLDRQLATEKEDANRAYAEAHAARVEAKLAHAEDNLAIQHAAEAESNHSSLCSFLDRAEAATRT
jgi:chromosome segregation ATPase